MRTSRHIAVGITIACLAGLASPAISAAEALTRTAGAASAQPSYYYDTHILSGASLSHTFIPSGSTTPMTEPLSGPDDLTALGGHLFTAFQNGVGAQGEPSSSGNLDSTIVEFTRHGKVVHQWDITGKCDGLTADPDLRAVIATVNEDGNSSLYTIDPSARRAHQVRHYHYDKPLPSKGGTDAISVYRGRILISASAPGTTGSPAPQASYPAVYLVTLHHARAIARIRPLFFDEAAAVVANAGKHGQHMHLALTDPDSNSVVPPFASRFRGAFMLTSQGDQQQIYAVRATTPRQRLFVLSLSQAIDDTAWATGPSGRLYATDAAANAVDVVTGPFPRGAAFVAVTPCDANNAPGTCPTSPPNYLGQLDQSTGDITPVNTLGPAFRPKSLLFIG
jgi:hypothetical protein